MSADRASNPVRVIRQSALTSSLLGVDFVPVYRREGVFAETAPGDVAEHAAPEVVVMPAARAPVPAVRPAPASAAPAPVAPARSTRPPAAPVDSPTPSGLVPDLKQRDYSGDPKRSAVLAELTKIRARYDADAPHQHFVTDHHSIVFGEGDPCARLVFVGEAPGADEDRTGRPFVGRAGQLLTKMIVAMGLEREDVYITNVLKTRPPNNATPTIEEARLCSPYLFQQLRAIRPDVVVTLGLPATRLLLNTDLSMSALRGRWHEFSYEDVRIPVMPTYHPAFLLRSYTKENREKVWSDLQKAMQRLGAEGRPGVG
jgi:DNA polymerase